MKKVFIFAAAIALTLASCGNKTQGNAAGTDSATATENVDSASAEATEGEAIDETALSDDSKATITNLTTQLQKAITAKDSKATITTLANLQTIYKNLVAQGKLDEAKAYGASIKKLVSENAESIKNVADGNVTILQLIDGVKNLPTSAATTAEQAKAAINSDVTNLASPVIAKGETALATAKAAEEAIKNAPAAAKAAAENAASQAVSNAKDAASQAASNAKTAAENKVNSEVQKANAKATSAVNSAKAKAEAKAAEAKAKNDAAKQKAAAKVNEAKQKTNDAVNKAANKAIKDLLK